jgi:AraC-like DNA-binding protein
VAEFDRLASSYRDETTFDLAAIDRQGALLRGKACCCASSRPARASRSSSPTRVDAPHSDLYRQATGEALRWGDPCIMCCPSGYALWALPVMHNHEVLGGLLVAGVPLDRQGEPAGALDRRLLDATRALLELAGRHNLTNLALLEKNRLAAERESGRAEAIHALKERLYDDIRGIYLREEPALLAAIQRGERTAARGIINHILTAIYARGAGRHSLLKTLTLELVVMMARAAVQAGAEPEKILGLNYRSLTELAGVRTQEDHTTWLCEMLEQLIDAMGAPPAHPNAVQLARAIAHMERHYGENLGRDEVARAAGLSASHFSHLMKERAGATFTELLLRIRLDNARRLLVRHGAGVAEIAATCGFSDQSYFTRVFKKKFNETPNDYRHRIRTRTSDP